MTPYGFDMVNCFERPIAIMLENQAKGLGRTFLVCNAMVMNYSIGNNLSHNGFYFSDVHNYLSIKMKSWSIKRNINETLSELLASEGSLLVPGNLKMLFYSEHYMKSDWRHLFLVTRYDIEKNIFYILDNEQQKYENECVQYQKFAMLPEILNRVFDKYIWLGERRLVYRAEYSEFNIQHNLKKIISNLENKINEKTYSQDYYINEMLNINDENEPLYLELQKLLLSSVKYKYVMINEINEILELLNIPNKTLLTLNKEVFLIWNKCVLKALKKIKKRKEYIGFSETADIQVIEGKLKEEFHNILQIIDEVKINCEDEHIINDFDGIIHKNDRGISFIFHSIKTYNWWKEDNCPKYIIKKRSIINKFKLNCTFRNIKGCQSGGCQFGLYVKTDTNEKYAMGYDAVNGGEISLIGVRILCQKSVDHFDEMYIQRIIYDGINIFFEIQVKDIVYQIGCVSISSNISEVGIYCKTWDLCTELEIHITDVIFHEE